MSSSIIEPLRTSRGKAIDKARKPLMSPETGLVEKPTFDRVGEDAGERSMKHHFRPTGRLVPPASLCCAFFADSRMNFPTTRSSSPDLVRRFRPAILAVPLPSLRGTTSSVASHVTCPTCCARSPAFAVSHSGVVGSQTQVRVRGSEANHVLVLIDGVRANDPATGDEFRWEYPHTVQY